MTKEMEDIAHRVARLDRGELLDEIRNFRGRFPLDFTPDFLGSQSDESLRHILFTAKFQQEQQPQRTH